MPAPKDHPLAIPLWPAGAPGLDPALPDTVPVLIPHLLPGDKPRPTVIVCPGGGYGGRAAHEGDPIALWLNSIGISAFVLHYRVSPYRFPIPGNDLRQALRLIRARAAEWRVDGSHLGILGFSAGGHLCASVGVYHDAGDASASDPVARQSCRPDAMILCYPVVSFTEFGHSGSMRNLLGPEPSQEQRLALSLERQANAQTSPAFIWHTADDPGVPALNSIEMAAALARHKVPYALHVFPHGRHGVGLATDNPELSQWTRLCEQWLRTRGF